jgi:hypothetical protein
MFDLIIARVNGYTVRARQVRPFRKVAAAGTAVVVAATAWIVLAPSAAAGTAYGCTSHAAYPYRHNVTEIDYSGSVKCTSGKFYLSMTILNEYFKHASDTNSTWSNRASRTCSGGNVTSCSVSSNNQPFFGAGYYCTVTEVLIADQGAVPNARTCTTYS